MYRFPLSQGAGAGTIRDARNELVMILQGLDTGDKNKRAQFVCDSLNNPMAAALDKALTTSAIASARGDTKAAEFWHRLAGSLRKACTMT